MAEMLESVNPYVDLERHDSDCYFCNKKDEDPPPATNDYTDDFADDTLIGVATAAGGIEHQNNSGKLGKACAPSPGSKWIGKDQWNMSLMVQFAAHHLIPGDASLKPSNLISFLKDEGTAAGNVGYDVNNKINGVWLPGNYAFGNIKQWGKAGAKFQSTYAVQPQDYASAAIEQRGCQFHDSHPDYSTKVLDLLNNIAAKLRNTKEEWCPKAKESPDKPKPLYILITRLATVSLRLRKMLVFPMENWKIDVFTSAFSANWMAEQKKKH